jgi:hypothetical protein
MSHEVRICPECGEEYTLVPSECADCRVPLVFPDEIEPEAAPIDFPPVSDLECVRVGPLPWTRALSAALESSEIQHRVEPDTRSEAEGGVDRSTFDGADVFGTWVMPGHLEAAREIDKVVFAHIHGQQSDAPEASADEVCPACESPIGTDALECSDCGLSFA